MDRPRGGRRRITDRGSGRRRQPAVMPLTCGRGRGEPDTNGRGSFGMKARKAGAGGVSAGEGIETAYATRGSECAYANLKLVTRVVSAVYDEALRPCGLRASQLALLVGHPRARAGRARAPRRGHAHGSDDAEPHDRHAAQGGTGRAKRRASDRRVKTVRLTAAGRARFRAAMPLWEDAQRQASAFLPLDDVRAPRPPGPEVAARDAGAGLSTGGRLAATRDGRRSRYRCICIFKASPTAGVAAPQRR